MKTQVKMKAALTGTAFPKPANYETLISRVEETFPNSISQNSTFNIRQCNIHINCIGILKVDGSIT
jgi:hypothetical protein